MSQESWQRTIDRWFGYQHAFDHPVTVFAIVAIAALAVLAGAGLWGLHRTGRMDRATYADLLLRWKSWIAISVCILVPILLGAAWTMGLVALLCLACFSDFARVTGLFRQKAICAVVLIGIGLLTFAVVDRFERLFFALAPWTVSLIAAAGIVSDRPKGYVERVALGGFGFLMFGFSISYLGNMANVGDLGNGADYRPILVMIFLGVELNDILVFCLGRLLGGPLLLPNTSPDKTVVGAIGAMLITTPLVAIIGHFVFRGTPVDQWGVLATIGLLISMLGQLGELILASVKRDVGVTYSGAAIPGHGGLLDRFDSLILVPPALYHYLSYQLGPQLGSLGPDTPVRIFSAGG